MPEADPMTFVEATAKYESWLGKHLVVVQSDLKLKHEQMRSGIFPFFRATYYRWAQIWPVLCEDLASAPVALAVGDLHVENFGTWRDTEGRLIWGINDFDEVWKIPYTNDLVRLAASMELAASVGKLAIGLKDAAVAIVQGYRDCCAAKGRPLVLAESNLDLREMAVSRLKDPGAFWRKLDKLPTCEGRVPEAVTTGLARLLPARDLKCRYAHRIAGLGSLGRERFVAIAEWGGGQVAREAKALAPSACAWAEQVKGSPRSLYQEVLERAVRCPDPFVRMDDCWIIRRLAPDCSRIELSDLPKAHDEARLLYYMGWETANVHIGTVNARALLSDLDKRKGKWLFEAAARMAQAVREDWKAWRER
jgi:Uncharacterized protein conserved in bacteria (DUF2252)